MKTKIFVILAIITVVFLFYKAYSMRGSSLTSPQNIGTDSKQNTPTPYPSPKTFKFDGNTNLEQELESINPEILESDFDELKNLLVSL